MSIDESLRTYTLSLKLLFDYNIIEFVFQLN